MTSPELTDADIERLIAQCERGLREAVSFASIPSRDLLMLLLALRTARHRNQQLPSHADHVPIIPQIEYAMAQASHGGLLSRNEGDAILAESQRVILENELLRQQLATPTSEEVAAIVARLRAATAPDGYYAHHPLFTKTAHFLERLDRRVRELEGRCG